MERRKIRHGKESDYIWNGGRLGTERRQIKRWTGGRLEMEIGED